MTATPGSAADPWAENEQALLGCALLNGGAIAAIASEIRVEDFSVPIHGGIYAAMLRLHSRGIVTNPVTVGNEMGPALEAVGGLGYLFELTQLHPAVASWALPDYAATVKRNSVQRGLWRVGEMLAGSGGDMAERIQQGQDYLARALTRLHGTSRTDDGIITLPDLMRREFPPIRWVVPGILPEGAHLIVGKSKTGKSWLALGLALAVGYGGKAFESLDLESGDALYLALEDNERRLQDRFRRTLEQLAPPNNVHLALEWERLDEGGIDRLSAWLTDHPAARLVVVDTLKKMRSAQATQGQSVYDRDYESLDGLHQLAAQHHCAILIIHHMRKGVAEDPLDTINGSSGLAASVDGIWIFQRRRGENDATLYVTHREAEDQELALEWHPAHTSWTLEGDAGDYRISKERVEIIEFLQGHKEPLAHREIAEALEKNPFTSKRLVLDMVKDGLLERVGTKHYRVAPDYEEKKGKIRGPRGPMPDSPRDDAKVADHAGRNTRGPDHGPQAKTDHADHERTTLGNGARGPQLPLVDGENPVSDHTDHDRVWEENRDEQSIVPGFVEDDEGLF